MFNPPSQSTEFVWSPASVSAGTEMFFAMSDAQNRTGGTSAIKVSSQTGDTSCLNSNSPHVTLQGTSSTTGVSTTQTSPASSSSSGIIDVQKTPDTTVLVAMIVGIVVGLGALVALGIFLLRRRRRNQSSRQKRHFELDGKFPHMFAVSFSAITLVQRIIVTNHQLCPTR